MLTSAIEKWVYKAIDSLPTLEASSTGLLN